jgi:hypothetical protein
MSHRSFRLRRLPHHRLERSLAGHWSAERQSLPLLGEYSSEVRLLEELRLLPRRYRW